MNAPEKAAAMQEPSLAQDWLRALRYWLGGRRGLLALAGFAVVVGIGANWSWLVAVGLAPLLISVLPCVAMCALGLCMSRAMGGSCAGKRGVEDAAQGARPEVLPAATADANQLTLGLDAVGTAAQPAAIPPAAPRGVAQTRTSEEKTHA